MLKTIINLSPKRRFIFDLGIIFLTSILVVLPILFNGIPTSGDTPQQYQFAQTFFHSLLNGEFYPSWASSPNYGYGDVGVRFYPPLTYFILSFFRFVSGNWYDATLLFFISIYFLSGLGIYLWSRERFSENSSLFGAFVYILLPYHVLEIYVGTVFSEFTAMALLPFCFWFISRVCLKGRLIDIGGLAFFYGLLIITHLPTILTSSLAFLVFASFSLKKEFFFRSLGKLALSVGFALLLSSFYWVRMVSEMSFVKHNSPEYIAGFYHYNNQFLLSYLFPYLANYSEPSNILNVIGILTLGVMISFSLLYFSKTGKNGWGSLKNVTIVTVLALFMATPLSTPVWEFIPVLQKIQFPWRWLTLFSLGTAFIAAAGFGVGIEYLQTSKRYLSILALGLFLICLPYTYFRMMNPIITFPKDYLNRVAEGFRTMPSYECWWTIWTPVDKEREAGLPRPKLLPAKVVINERAHEVKTWSPTERVFNIRAGEAGQAQVATLYYPHWKATVNGQPVEVTGTEKGLISFPVPTQESEVRVYFQEPQRVIISYYTSGLAWISMFGLLSISLIRNFKQPNDRE